MKHIAIFSLLVAQLVCVPASNAASLHEPHYVGRDAQSQAGTFAGARFRMALGGKKKEKARAGFTFAPLRSGVSTRGTNFTQIGEGLEFGFSDRVRSPSVTIAGYALSPRRAQAAAGQEGEEGAEEKKRGPSALGSAAIIVGGLALAAGILVLACTGGANCLNSD